MDAMKFDFGSEYAASLAEAYQSGQTTLEAAARALTNRGADRRSALRFLVEYTDLKESA